MNCLSWWLPLFVLPLPVCPPELFALFVVTYMLRTRPCAYCCLVLVGLFISTSYWSNSTPWKPSVPALSDFNSAPVGSDGSGDASAGPADRLLRISLPKLWQGSPMSHAHDHRPAIVLDPGFDWRHWVGKVRTNQ